MPKSKKLFIVGDGAFAEVAYECFTVDSEYEVVGFTVEKQYLKKSNLFGLPIFPFEDIEKIFSKDTYFYVAITYTELNRLRTRLYEQTLSKGYIPAKYISSNSRISRSAQIGEHCFIFEYNNVQPFTKIDDNVVLWSSNHLGHHSIIHRNCFISSHVVISGFCSIGQNTFMGVNSSVANNISVAEDNWVGIGAILAKDTEPNSLFKGIHSEASRVSSKRFFKVR